MTNLLEARRVAVLLDELVEVIQNLALALGERLHKASWPGEETGENPGGRGRVAKQKAKVNFSPPPWPTKA